MSRPHLAWAALLWAGCTGAVSPSDDHDHETTPPAQNNAHEDVITLSEAALASSKIVVQDAAETSLTKHLTFSATITLDPQQEALVSAWVGGQVGAVRARAGDTVKEGQVLAKVQTPNLGEAIAAWRSAKAQDDAVDARLERLRQLQADGVTSQSQVLQAESDHAAAVGSLEAAEERLRILGVDPTVGNPHAGEHYPSTIPVTSPIAGKVLTVDASVGERVEPGQTLVHIGNLDEVWLMLNVYERDIAAVRVGQPVSFTVQAWPEAPFVGTVEQVGDWLDPDARTLQVRVVVPNPDHRLKPNMFAEASLAVDHSQGATGIVLPADALADVEGSTSVFIERTPGTFAVRPVVVADRSATEVRLRSGVSAGERVVVDGAFTLKSELVKSEMGSGHAH